MRVMMIALANFCTRLGGSVTLLGLAACWIPKYKAARTGSMGGSSGRRDGGGAFPAVNLPVLLRKPGQSLNPRFVAWPLELGLGTRNPYFVAFYTILHPEASPSPPLRTMGACPASYLD